MDDPNRPGARIGGTLADDKGASDTQTSAYIVLGALVVVLVAGFVVLTATGRDTNAYTIFASGPVMTAIVGALLAKRQDAIRADLVTVKDQTNGQLAGQFAAASDERQAIADRTVAVVQGQPDPAAPTTLN